MARIYWSALALAVGAAAQAHAHQHPFHGHDHSDPDHMEQVHGVYRDLWPNGLNPMPLVPAELLQDKIAAYTSAHAHGPAQPAPYPAQYAQDEVPLTTPAGDSLMAGIATFAHLPFGACFSPWTHILPDNEDLIYEVQSGSNFDVAFVGMPFDTAVSFRPGARFGPNGIREGSKRMTKLKSYNVPMGLNPFTQGLKIIDCGDIPVTQLDNKVALKQMERGYDKLLFSSAKTTSIMAANGKVHSKPLFTKTGRVHPKIMTLGGDHTIVLPILRSLNKAYGPVSVIHFDSHLDTWRPDSYSNAGGEVSSTINHGSFFWHAAQEGLIRNGTSAHAGIRTRLSGLEDYENDRECGFRLDHAFEIDDIGTQGIIDNIRNRVGDNPVYLSIDIDVLDPSAAPATGTPETGGWTSREMRRILRGLEGMNIVGADIVEVAPPYDNQAMLTQFVAADLMFEVLSVMVKRGPLIDTK